MQTDRPVLESILFVALAFGIAWGLAGLLMLQPELVASVFGPVSPSHPLFYVAVWSPNIAAVLLTLWRGWPRGFGDLLSRLVRWRIAPSVWLTAILFYPVLMLIVQLTGVLLGEPMTLARIGGIWWTFASVTLISLPLLALGPLGEELGWRGYLLPRVLERASPLAAALIVGAIWMVWHLPAFFISGLPQEVMALPMFMIGGVALSVYITFLFVNARQSVLVAGIIPHAIVNAVGEATGPMTWLQIGVMVVGAVLLVVVLGPRLEVGEGGAGRSTATARRGRLAHAGRGPFSGRRPF